VTSRQRPPRQRDPRLDETRIQDESLTQSDPERLQRVEERLVPKVSQRQAGAVHLEKRVVEERESMEVTVRHDELDLERRRADRPLAADEQPVTERGDTTVVLVIEERLEVRKVPWVVEEIHLRRRLVAEQIQVEDTVRKERFEISTEGDVDLDNRDR
jgi:uncharacterized protein (TIGR02271 family)